MCFQRMRPAGPIRTLVLDDRKTCAVIRSLILADHDLLLLDDDVVCTMRSSTVRNLDTELLVVQAHIVASGEARTICGENPPWAMLIVACDERHAVAAFELGALDYLIEPLTEQRCRQAIRRAKRIAKGRRLMGHMAGLAPSSREVGRPDRISVPDGSDVAMINVEDIGWIGACNYYAEIHVGAKTYLLRASLNELEGRLARHDFVRIHRSALINLRHVQRLSRSRGGRASIVLSDGKALAVSRARYSDLLDRLRET